MDPIAHTLTGVLIAKSFKIADKKALLASAVVAEAPDMDVFAWLYPNPPYFLIHRSFSTHSFFAAALMAIALSFCFSRWFKISFWKAYGLIFTLLGAHIFSDLITSYGIPAFAPFTGRNFALDLIGNLNWPISLIIALGFYLRRFKPTKIWMAIAIFMMASLAAKAWATHRFSIHYPNLKLAVFPHILLPWQMRVIAATETSYQLSTLNILSGRIREGKIYERPKSDPIIEASKKEPVVRYFLKHNRWPVARVESIGPRFRVIWGNPLFSRDGTNIDGRAVVEMDDKGNILKSYRNLEKF